MNNFFERIQKFPQAIKGKKEETASVKQDILKYLLKSEHTAYPHYWIKFNDFLADGKFLEDKEIFDAIREGYLISLKKIVGELPIVETELEEPELSCLSRTWGIKSMFQDIEDYKRRKNKKKDLNDQHENLIMREHSFVEFFKNDPEFFRLTKEALIRSLNLADTSSDDKKKEASTFMPAAVTDEIKKSQEVQQAAKSAIIRSFNDDNLYIAIELKERLNLTEEMIQSSDFQQAARDVIKRKEEKLQKIEEEIKKDPMLLMGIDRETIWQTKQWIEEIRKWTIGKIEQ